MSTKVTILPLLALLWPVVAIGLAILSPGPGEAPQVQQVERRQRASLPPTDERGSTVFTQGDEAEGTAKVFWEEPGKVQVRMIVEIPPDAAGAETDADSFNSQ